nr:retrovirus-related Pol polyprotein from transposon TNT 1-94 [Tanacetum cinerariifolium]
MEKANALLLSRNGTLLHKMYQGWSIQAKKTVEGDDKPESQWTPDERRVNFQKNSDDEVDERSSEEYLKDSDIEFHKRALLADSKCFIKRRNNFSSPKANENTECYKCGKKGHLQTGHSSVSKGFQPKFTLKLIESSKNSISQAYLKAQKDYKAEYKRLKAKIALHEANPSSSQNPKTFQPKNKGLVAETFDWDEEEVSDDEDVTQIKVLTALANDELTVGKNHARNGEWIDITMKKVNILLSMDEDADWKNYLKYINIDLNEQIPHQKKKVLGGELFSDSSSKINENENLFVPASMGYDQEMVPKTKDWVERLNPHSKLLNFNTGRILVPESQAVNESLESTKTLNTPESSKNSKAESFTPLPSLKIFQGASPSLEVMPLTFQPHSPKVRPGLGIMKHTKPKTHDSLDKSVSGTVTVSETEPTRPSIPTEDKNTEQESKINELTKLVQMLVDENVNSTKMTQESNSQIQQTESSKILCCMIYKREDHRTSDHEMYTASLKKSENYEAQPYKYASSSKQILKAKAKPFPPCTHCGFSDYRPGDCRNYSECGIYGSYDHFTSRHNRVIHIRGGMLVDISQLCDAKYIVQFDDKQGTIFNANKEIVLIAPRRNDVLYVLDMSLLTPNGACFFAKASESINWLWHKRLSHLNFKNINKLAKQNKVLGLPSLVYSKDKSCSACEKGKHHKASFKTKQNFSIRKCLHLLHMDLFGQVSPMSINHEKYTLVIIDEYSRERIPDISYFHVFGCPVFIHNHKDHLGKFDAKADDGYFLGYSFVSKAFKVFNTRRQQVEESYHVTFDESMEAIRFINTSVDEIGINDSSRYPRDEFLQEDDPSRQYQVDSDVSYYIIPYGRSLTELTQKNHVSESHLSNQASTSSYLVPQDRWSKDQHIELVNIIGDPGEGMLIKSIAAKLTAASASECLFADFLSEIEPKKVFEALKHPGWIDAMQEEPNQFYRNKVWTLLLLYGKIAIGSK